MAEQRRRATETLARGDIDRARRQFEEVLKTLHHDGPAERDAGRAAAAAGEFEYAAEALEKAHHFEGHKPDPELHYLRGEALYTLGRDEEAAREQRIAELEIGPDPDRSHEEALAGAHLRAARLSGALGSRLRTDAPRAAVVRRGGGAQPGRRASAQQGLGGRGAASAPLPGARSEERPRSRDARLGARGRRRSRRRAGRPTRAGGGSTDGRQRVRLRARARARDQLPRRQHRVLGRAQERRRGRQHRPHLVRADALRVTPELSGGGWYRSDPQAWDWRRAGGRGVAVRNPPPGGGAGLARRLDRLERQSGGRPERAARKRLGHRPRRLRDARPPVGRLVSSGQRRSLLDHHR